ncbi:MAG: hypothetical protein NW218_02210 [Saprospiraceae bacterium]|nr:hypothetical protein [Saprospiraceae bacterium]
MKNILLLSVLCFLGFTTTLFAQIKLGDNPTVLQPSAVLEMESNSKGMLMPRMTAAQKEAIVLPASGLTIYQTDGDTGFWYYDGTQWRKASLPSGTQTGDMLYWNGSTWMLLPSGQQGQPLVYCNGVPQWGACVPTVTTNDVTEIKHKTSKCGGSVTFNGGSIVTSQGICWSLQPNPTVANNNSPATLNNPSFVAYAYDLLPDTTYYVRAFATNSAGTGYGIEKVFKTLAPSIPTLNGGYFAPNTDSSGYFEGYSLSENGSNLIESGFCWSINPNPTVNDFKFVASNQYNITGTIDGLIPGQLYHGRGYAINGVGIGYSNDIAFRTAELYVVTNEVNSIAASNATSGGCVYSNSNSQIFSKGICWSTSPNPTINDNKTNEGNGSNCFTSFISGLNPLTTYYIRAYATNLAGTAYGQEISFTTLNAFVSTLSTSPITNISSDSASSGGTIQNAGGAPILSKGLCWNTSPNPTILDSTINVGSGNSSFAANLTNLNVGTTYYVRAFATNAAGTGYGNEYTFSTLGYPIVESTNPATNITFNSAVSGGVILSDGGSNIQEKGVCWDLNPNPSISNDHTTEGTGISAFSSTLNNLQGNSTYYLRAYATNSLGTSYGPEITFTTLPSQLPTLTTNTINYIVALSASGGGNITNDGGASVTARGVCWSTSPNPTTANSISMDGTGTGLFGSSLTGISAGTTYYVRAYATNSMGTAYGNELSFTTLNLPILSTSVVYNILATTASSGGTVASNGGNNISSRGVCWGTSPNPTVNNSTQYAGGGLGSFNVDLSNLIPNTVYYVRAFATTAAGIAYGNEQSFITPTPSLPVVFTGGITYIESNFAGVNGIVTSIGNAQLLEGGICWSTSTNPTISNFKRNVGAQIGNFNADVYYLLPATTYYLKAYATNIAGTSYGAEITLTTLGAPPTLSTNNPTNITATSAVTGGVVVDNGGLPLTEKGICWSANNVPSYYDNHTNEGAGDAPFTSTLTNLLPGTTYFVRAYGKSNGQYGYGNLQTITTQVTAPEITTTVPYNITQTAATSGGYISSAGGLPVSARGVCWSTSSNPTINDNLTIDGTGVGTYNSSLSGLSMGITYYVRAYATNGAGTAYGAEYNFTIPPPTIPTVSTSPVENIIATTATGFGQVNSDGAAAIITRGICWSTSPNPTINDSKSENNGGIGSYEESITGLTAGTTYYVRAFATNSIGTAYGNEVSFTSLTLPILSTSIVYNILATTASSGGTVASDGGSYVNNRGLCWSTNPNPTINNSAQSAGTGLGSFSLDMTSLTSNTTYYVRAFATTSAGTAYGNEQSFTTLTPTLPVVFTTNIGYIYSNYTSAHGIITSIGNAQLIESGFCWSTSTNPTISNFKTNSGAQIGNFNAYLYNLQPSTTYYLKAYATNIAGTAYGNEITFTTLGDVPTLSTNNTTNITSTSAESGGVVINNGGFPLTEKGVCWSSNNIPNAYNNHTNDGTGDTPFTSTLTNLEPGTTYFVRAYGRSNGDYGYGNLQTITTQVTAPVLNTTAPFNITQTTANSGGEIQSVGGLPISERGVCWSTSPSPTVNDNKTTEGPGNSNFTSNITGLTLGITYYVRSYATNAVGTAYGNEISFQTLLPANVTTNLVTNLTATNANSGGVITSDGGNPVTDRGVCWSTSPNPTYNGISRTYEGSGTGPFSSALSNLQPGTTYYVRAFGVTAAGPGYGQEETFTTTIPVLATLSTNPISDIYSYYAFGGGNITNDGGATITERGLCWSTTPNPTIANYRSYEGGGSGFFNSYMFSLSSGTFYYVRAYATSIAGTAYGEERTFTTLGAAPTLTTNVISSIAATTAVSGGIVINNGGVDISSKGVIWSSSNIPYIYNYQGITNEGSGSAPFISTLTNLSPGTTYYVRAYATNNGETGYGNLYTFTTTFNVPSVATSLVSNIDQTSANGGGNVTNNGGQNVIERGVCWSTSPSPTINDNKLAIGAGNGGFSGSMTGLTLGVTYYVRAYATNSVGTDYGAQVSFTTAVTYATVSTDPITNITATTATGGGNVSSQGGSAVTARGVCWSINPNPTLFNPKTINGSGTGTFSSNLSNLLPGKTYYVRAYASNSAGTAYGQQQTFTTSTTLPTLTGKPVIYITLNGAQSGGNISNDGGANVSERGVCWSISPNPTTSNSKTVDGTGSGVYTSTIGGLSSLTTYYLRAYATNSVGTVYGNQVIFKTTNLPVAIGQAYQGGIICYIDATGEHGLIVSNGMIVSAPYGCVGTETGASGIAIGTGVVNTGTILQSCNEPNTGAKICDDYTIIDGGVVYDDWFLPSLDEVISIYTNLYLNNLGEFSNPNQYYFLLSSSEISSNYYWSYIIYNTGSYNDNYPNQTFKSNNSEVRAMRTF